MKKHVLAVFPWKLSTDSEHKTRAGTKRIQMSVALWKFSSGSPEQCPAACLLVTVPRPAVAETLGGWLLAASRENWRLGALLACCRRQRGYRCDMQPRDHLQFGHLGDLGTPNTCISRYDFLSGA